MIADVTGFMARDYAADRVPLSGALVHDTVPLPKTSSVQVRGGMRVSRPPRVLGSGFWCECWVLREHESPSEGVVLVSEPGWMRDVGNAVGGRACEAPHRSQ
ncbi:hypothetical protein, partial [Streptomyces sp. NPDC055134]